MRQILEPLNYMHYKGYVHRDIKPENLMIEHSDNSIKLIDFGLSIFLPKDDCLKDRQGSAYYMAPEVLSKNYNHKCDVWSCGVILYLLLSGKLPFSADHHLEVMRLIKIGHYNFYDSKWFFISPLAKDLIMNMLKYNPA
jgi:calcium-dependent protein kinase